MTLLHCPLSSDTVPSGHKHATLRDGIVSLTTHSCEAVHGLLISQGFWHWAPMQASLDGQSESTLHSGSIGVFTGKSGIILSSNLFSI